MFYYLYKALAHPELDGYVTPFTLEERLMHVAEAERTLGSEITWLADTMENDAKHALGDSPNSEFVFDKEGRLVTKRLWSDPEALREDLAKLAGSVKTPTRVSDLDMKTQPKREGAAKNVVLRLEVPWGMQPLRVEPILDDPDMPFYVKLRAEAERSLLEDDEGKLYFGFFLDPLYEVHWNNLVDAIHFELDLPEAVSATPSSERGPNVDVDADADPREFLIDVEGSSGRSHRGNRPLFRLRRCGDLLRSGHAALQRVPRAGPRRRTTNDGRPRWHDAAVPRKRRRRGRAHQPRGSSRADAVSFRADGRQRGRLYRG